MRRFAHIALIASAAASLWPQASLTAQTSMLDGLVATVGSRVIVLSDLRLARDLGFRPRNEPDEATVANLVDRALMLAEVERFQQPDPLEAQLESSFTMLRASLGAAWL